MEQKKEVERTNYCIILRPIHVDFRRKLYAARALGFEPRKAVLETAVIPFHHARML